MKFCSPLSHIRLSKILIGRHGAGVLKASDGFFYEGMWDHNAMDGRGSATYPSGQRYDGMFVNGRRDGRGTIYFTNGAVYEGRFRDDAIDGQGTMKMSRSMVVPRSHRRKLSIVETTTTSSQADSFIDEQDADKGDDKTSNPDEKSESKSKVEETVAGVDAENVKNKDDDKSRAEVDRQNDRDMDDFMIPISFQSDMTHIHAKAGFTAVGH